MRRLTPVSSEHPSDLAVAEVANDAIARPSIRRRVVIMLAALASFLWVAASVAAVLLIARFQPPGDLTLSAIAGLAAGVTAPLTAIWLAALVLSRGDPDKAALSRLATAEARMGAVAARTRAELEAIEGALQILGQRVETLAGGIGAQSTALIDSADLMERRSATISSALARDRDAIDGILERMATSTQSARAEIGGIAGLLPDAERLSAALARNVADVTAQSEQRVRDLAQLLNAVDAATTDVRSRVDAALAQLDQRAQALAASGSDAASRIEARGESMASTVEAAHARTEDGLRQLAAAVAEQRAAIDAAAERARAVFVELGRTAAVDVEDRVRVSAELLAQLVMATHEVEQRTGTMVGSMERSFDAVKTKLALTSESTGATLSEVEARAAAVRESIHDLGGPLGEAQSMTRAVETAVVDLRQAVAQSIDMLGTALPDSVARTGEAVDTLRRLLAVMGGEIGRVQDAASAISVPVENGRAALDAAASALDARRAALEGTIGKITAQLAEARSTVADIETGADAAALTASTKLVEALARVREVSTQAQGLMRTALDGAVEEARAALSAASGTALRDSFLEPVERQLAEVAAAGDRTAEAGRLAAERLSRQLLALVEAAGVVEARIAATESSLEESNRSDLARRAELLLESLNSAAIDLAKPLGTEVTDDAWAAYVRGDRSIFGRRAVRLLDGVTSKSIARLYEDDAEFRDAARRYLHDFEALMKQSGADRAGSALSVALLGSDTGRLYVGLAQALERFRD
jgi:hypothetical protein